MKIAIFVFQLLFLVIRTLLFGVLCIPFFILWAIVNLLTRFKMFLGKLLLINTDRGNKVKALLIWAILGVTDIFYITFKALKILNLAAVTKLPIIYHKTIR